QAPRELRAGIPQRVHILTGGAAPGAAVIERIEAMGFEVTHGYGLTESYAGAVISTWQPCWNELPAGERARLKARQGVRSPVLEAVMVADPETLLPVPKDGETLGEVFLRGNNLMKGYWKSPELTEECFRGGWFHTGDLAVWHADGYIEVRDR